MKAALVFLLSISTSVFAADADFLRCRGITESAARLACYDAVKVLAVDPAVAARPASAGSAASASAPAVAPSQPAPAKSMSDQFGMENRTVPGTLDAIESTIPGRFDGWDAKSIIKLANGQVWQIADDTSRYFTITDAKVRIRRGALGAFYLEFEKVNYSPRVKRLQ